MDPERKEEKLGLGIKVIQEGERDIDNEKRRRGRESKRGLDRAPGKERVEGVDRIGGRGFE